MPVDSDVDLHLAHDRRELRRAPWAILTAISLGGGAGGLVRYGLGVWSPAVPGAFPWTIFAINVTGCLLIGVLMVLVSQVWPERQLLRPFLGVGVLGGYTTFSFHVVEAQDLIEYGAAPTAVLYLAGTAVAALVAVVIGMGVTRRLLTRWRAARQLAGRRADGRSAGGRAGQ